MSIKGEAIYIRLTPEQEAELIYRAKKCSWDMYEYIKSLIARVDRG